MNHPRASARVQGLPPYPLAGLMETKRRLVAAGHDVIDLGAGEAIMAPPRVAIDALREALADPAMSRYGFQLGYVPFREAVARYAGRRFGVELDPMTEVLPLVGSKEGLANLALAVADPGSVVVIPDPGYQAYLGGATAAGAEIHRVRLTADDGFLVHLDRLPDEVLRRTRLAYLNYPNNPTAAVASQEYLQATIDTCRRYGIVLAYDNPYVELTFEGYRAPSILELDGARDVAVEFMSMSKSFSMTGWRLGWAQGNEDLIRALSSMKHYLDAGPLLAVQRASVPVLDRAEEWLAPLVGEYGARRRAASDALLDAGMPVALPPATPYLWIRLPEGVEAKAFSARLLEDEHVVTLPGTAFGAGGAGYVRIALAEGGTRLVDAILRMGKVVAATAPA